MNFLGLCSRGDWCTHAARSDWSDSDHAGSDPEEAVCSAHCDVGTPTVWAARYLKMNGRRRLLGSFSHGSMAKALTQAIGEQVSYPERQVRRGDEIIDLAKVNLFR